MMGKKRLQKQNAVCYADIRLVIKFKKEYCWNTGIRHSIVDLSLKT